MIGGIGIFMSYHPREAKFCDVGEVEIEDWQPTLTIKEKEASEKMLEATQIEGDEHSKEWLNIFI
jgi:hypothetical protein